VGADEGLMPNTPPRILVIEKDDLIRSLMRDILEGDGYRALMTENWLDPDDVRQLRPTAMILDPFSSGEADGWDYLRLLRGQPGMASLPVIVCTANHERLRDITAPELAMASAVILKPFDLDELLETIECALQPVKVLAPLPWPGPRRVIRRKSGVPEGDD
jgi:DNA-binding response OmpR family regulator